MNVIDCIIIRVVKIISGIGETHYWFRLIWQEILSNQVCVMSWMSMLETVVRDGLGLSVNEIGLVHVCQVIIWKTDWLLRLTFLRHRLFPTLTDLIAPILKLPLGLFNKLLLLLLLNRCICIFLSFIKCSSPCFHWTNCIFIQRYLIINLMCLRHPSELWRDNSHILIPILNRCLRSL